MQLWPDFKSGSGQSGPAETQIALIKYQGAKSLESSHLNPHQEEDAEFKSSCFRPSMKADQPPTAVQKKSDSSLYSNFNSF